MTCCSEGVCKCKSMCTASLIRSECEIGRQKVHLIPLRLLGCEVVSLSVTNQSLIILGSLPGPEGTGARGRRPMAVRQICCCEVMRPERTIYPSTTSLASHLSAAAIKSSKMSGLDQQSTSRCRSCGSLFFRLSLTRKLYWKTRPYAILRC